MGNQPSAGPGGGGASTFLLRRGSGLVDPGGGTNVSSSTSTSNTSSSNTSGTNSSGTNSSGSRDKKKGSSTTVSSLDFSNIFLDGDAWQEAEQQATFLSKINQRLLDPSLVAALHLDDEQGIPHAQYEARTRTAAFERALAAGAFPQLENGCTPSSSSSSSSSFPAGLKPHFHDDLASTLHLPPYLSTLQKRLALLQYLHPQVARFRSAAQRPLLHRPLRLPPLSAEDSNEVRLAYSMNK
eukprot:evm.model.NODE_14319_length_7238_cov_33.526665.1